MFIFNQINSAEINVITIINLINTEKFSDDAIIFEHFSFSARLTLVVVLLNGICIISNRKIY